MRFILISFFVFIPSIILLSYNNNINHYRYEKSVSAPPYSSYHSTWAKTTFDKLNSIDKIGQMIMLPAYPMEGFDEWEKLGNTIQKYNIGGIVIFRGTPVRTAKMINYLQSRAKIPLMVAIDGEWGLNMRIDSVLEFPHQMQIGAVKNNSLIYEYGVEVAKQLKRIGININFAPVVDINNNPNNPVINSRSFGEDKNNVSTKAYIFSKALQDNNILAVAKHFPGHGNTAFDSHKTLPVIIASRQELDSIELYPFKYLIKRNIGGIMSAHLEIPALDSTKNLASSLSKNIVGNLLRKELNYKGLIITDALNMKGVTGFFKAGEIEQKAIEAGNDILLMPQNTDVAIDSILSNLKLGKLSQEKIETSVKKILNLKYWLGLNKNKKVDTLLLSEQLNSTTAIAVKQNLIKNSITLVHDSQNIIPITNLKHLKIASLEIGYDKNRVFNNTLNKYLTIEGFKIPKNVSISQINQIDSILRDFDFVILSVHNTNRYSKNYGLNRTVWESINKITKNHQVIFVNFANPYSLSKIKDKNNFAAIIEAYNDDEISQSYAAQLIFGGIAANGILPISTKLFPIGTGIKTHKTCLEYNYPMKPNGNYSYESRIDSIINDAISKKAIPGCQIIAIQNGRVFFDKNYGFLTYKKNKKVNSATMYDLASLTKILSTLPSLMYLYDRNQISINAPLKKYLPETDTTNKGNIILKSILAHQARLQPWIPFYLYTFSPNSRNLNTFLYTKKQDSIHYTKVANNLYILNTYKDSMYTQILASKLRNRYGYRYSDLGFYLFKEIIEKETHSSIDKFTDSIFYSQLGARHLTYNPLNKFSKFNIAPTENDLNFRKQLLQGYVHDYGAAMMGGIGGHAGLFGNANDVAKILQMYLNGGTYGNHKYINKSTIHLFTQRPYKNNRRALGFDKPPIKGFRGASGNMASSLSYGHTGFTGTMVWIDPKYNFIYIFLSNRVYPNIENEKLIKMNIRSKVHDEFYKTVIKNQMQL